MPLNKTRKRKSPSNSATEFEEGTIKWGNNNKRWVIKKTDKGVHRWVPFYSTTLFGYSPLTVKYIAAHIGKPITVYERASMETWPKKSSDFDVKYIFTPSGDAEKDGKIFSGWLKSKTPTIKKNDLFRIQGIIKSNDIDSLPQASPLPDELVSTNLMNTDAFIKV